MNYPLVSVVMPVYNAEEYLEEAINSILNQTYHNFEFIIINDGSTDNSLEIIEKYRNQDERIIVISRNNKGLIDSLNEGIDKAKGKYIARMDADDISLSERFEIQINFMEKENLDICGCHYAIINRYGKYIDMIYVPLDNLSLILYLILAVPFAHGSIFVRKSFLNKNHLTYGQKTDHAEDKALWIQMYEEGANIGNVNQILFKYREFNQSLSKRKSNSYIHDDKRLKHYFIQNNSRNVTNSVINLGKDIEKLSHREIEYLGDILILMLFKYKKLLYWQIFKKLPSRYKLISVFKALSKLI